MLYVTKRLMILVCCLILIFTTGCWNNRNLTDLGIVIGMGLDKVSNDQIEITVQLLIPSIIESQKQGGMKKATNSIYARGKTVFEANRNLLTKINKKLFYGHLQLVVIGEKLAKEGMNDVLDFFQRVHEIDKRELILISKGISPKELFFVKEVQSDISTLEIVDTIKNTYRLASIRKETLYDVILDITSKKNPVVGIVEVSHNAKNKELTMTDMNFKGAAAFAKDKLVGWLNPIETYAFLITDNKFENPVLTIPNPICPGEYVTLEIIDSSASKKVYFKNEKPVFYIEVKITGNMVEQHGEGDLTLADKTRALETEASQKFKTIISNVVKKAQYNLHSDIFGFEDLVHKKNLSYWKKTKDNWGEVFSQLPVKIDVQYKNNNMGFIKAHK